MNKTERQEVAARATEIVMEMNLRVPQNFDELLRNFIDGKITASQLDDIVFARNKKEGD